jgi:hypothetical protein
MVHIYCSVINFLDTIPITIIKPGVVGLTNIGSTCYINSSLQCLNAATRFRKDIVSEHNTVKDDVLITAMQAVLRSVWTEKGVHHSQLGELKNTCGNALAFKVSYRSDRSLA